MDPAAQAKNEQKERLNMSDDIAIKRAKAALLEAEISAAAYRTGDSPHRSGEVAAQPPATPAETAVPPATPEIPSTPAPAETVAASEQARGVPQPGTQLTSDGLTALLRDKDAFVAYEESPGGKAELDRVSLEE